MPIATASPDPYDVGLRIRRLEEALRDARASARQRTRKLVLTFVALCGLIMLAMRLPGWYWFLGLTWIGRRTTSDAAASRRLYSAVADVAQFDDIRALDALLAARQIGAAASRKTAETAALRLLKLVGPEDRGTVSPRTIRAIDCLLDHFQPDTLEAALAALKHVGDAQSLVKVRALLGIPAGAAKPPHGPQRMPAWTKSLPRLAEIARSTLATLEARVAEERNSSRLLRPAAEGGQERLLRPSTSSSTPPEQLLRAPEEA